MPLTTRSPIPRLLTLAAALALLGCASSSSSKGGETKKSRPIRLMSTIEVSPPSLMVAKKIERPLVIVLDPEKVADVVGTVKWGLNRYDVTEFHLFVERDLKRAMEAFFTDVSVVKAGEPLPDSGVVVADVRVDKLEGQVIGQVAVTELTWAFALRPVEADTYLFSYAGKSSSEPRRSVNKMIASALERAIGDLVSAWADKGVTQALRELSGAGGLKATGETSEL